MAHYSYTLLRRGNLDLTVNDLSFFNVMLEGSCYSNYPQIEEPMPWSNDPFVMDIYNSAISEFNEVPKERYSFVSRIKITAELLRKIYLIVSTVKQSDCEGC